MNFIELESYIKDNKWEDTFFLYEEGVSQAAIFFKPNDSEDFKSVYLDEYGSREAFEKMLDITVERLNAKKVNIYFYINSPE